MRLTDNVAIVTGGASGIGAATALAMAREGARVLVVDLNEAGAKATVEQIEKAGGQAGAARADVTRAGDNQAVVEQAVARWGRLDVFYANAGVPQWKSDLEDVEEALEAAPHGVRVVAIAPVATHTPMLPTFMNERAVDAESLRLYEATVPLGRLNQPEDIAATAVFLASDDAAMITGSCVEVDGGRCI
jgi:3-oxoacyl-[acyl-carrier protein] reductase